MKSGKLRVAGRFTLVATLLATIGLGSIVASAEPAEAATAPPVGQCIVDHKFHDEENHKEYKYSQVIPGSASTSHDEFQYSKVIPGTASTSHDEFQYSQVTTVYTVEHKVITIPSSGNNRTLVINWLNSIGGINNGNDKWQIPDDVVNDAGVKVIGPGAVAPTGNVPLSAYGGPNVTVPYEITGVDISTTPPAGSLFVTNHDATIYYVHGANPTATLTNANWTTDAPGAPWSKIHTKSVSNNDAVPDKTVYYLPGGGQSDTLTNANWTTDVPGGWTQIHTKSVSNNDAVPDKTVYYLPGGGQSDTNTDANWTTDTPTAPWTKIANTERTVKDKDGYVEDIYGPCEQLPCTATSSQDVTPDTMASLGWGTEDGLPAFTVDSLEFNTPLAGDRQNIFNGTYSTPVEGLTHFSYVVEGKVGVTAQASLKMEGLTQGNSGYATWSFEPYQNGMAVGDGTPHVFQITDFSLIWSSKITNPDPGSQANPQTVAWFKNTYPNALMRVGLQQGAGNAGALSHVSVVSWQDGDGVCITASFTLDEIAAPPAPMPGDATCLADGTRPTLNQNGTYDRPDTGPGTYYATYPAPMGNKFPGNVTSVTYPVVVPPKLASNDPLCQVEVTPVNPDTKAAYCKAGNPIKATYTVPTTLGVEYYKDGKVIDAGTYSAKPGEKVTITAKAVDDTYVLTDQNWSWDKTFPAITCIGELPLTGSSITGMIWSIFGPILAGLTLLLIKRYRKKFGFGGATA